MQLLHGSLMEGFLVYLLFYSDRQDSISFTNKLWTAVGKPRHVGIKREKITKFCLSKSNQNFSIFILYPNCFLLFSMVEMVEAAQSQSRSSIKTGIQLHWYRPSYQPLRQSHVIWKVDDQTTETWCLTEHRKGIQNDLKSTSGVVRPRSSEAKLPSPHCECADAY